MAKDFYGKDYGKCVAAMAIPATGGLSKYKSVTGKLEPGITKKHHVYLVYKNTAGGSINIDSVKFIAGKVPDMPSPVVVLPVRAARANH